MADHVMGHERERSASVDLAEAAKRLFGSTGSVDVRARECSDQLQTMQVGGLRRIKEGVFVEKSEEVEQIEVVVVVALVDEQIGLHYMISFRMCRIGWAQFLDPLACLSDVDCQRVTVAS